ncbi:hypothetical protein IEQ34_004256 [Dendrobium chrysotoxum]|uniref:Uncharacterized protein n=1 Tax=Dendrobium chrysotoxum TaxID=161865 RepID=A0AAV7HHN9_DENCH|nr:hypothetical protein IEQ34_004256 [Dendrobium chrysotoxum]
MVMRKRVRYRRPFSLMMRMMLRFCSTKDREPLKPTQDRVQIVLDDLHIILDDLVKTETLIRATKLRGSD